MKRAAIALAVPVLLLMAAPLPAQQFGGSVAVSGDEVLVGETGNQILPGIVYRFRQVDGAWREVGQLTASDNQGPPDGFGRALAVQGETVLVGAPGRGDGAGAVYVLRRGASGAWEEAARLEPGDAMEDDGFGAAVALSGDHALIAAPGQGDGAGAAYVFRRGADGAWAQAAKLVGDGVAAGDGFGATVALAGGVALVSTRDRPQSQGAVFAFRRDGAGGWIAQGRLAVDGLDERSGYGAALGLLEGTALVGAPNADGRTGAVFTFAFDDEAGGWSAAGRLAPFQSVPNARFGSSIAFDGGTTLIGAPGEASGRGAVYLFGHGEDGEWTRASRLVGAGLDERASLASTVAVAGDVAVMGALGVDSRAGAAVVFAREGDGWRMADAVVNEVRGLPAVTGGEVRCTDNHAVGFECSEVDVVAFLPTKDIGGSRGTSVNDIWGWTDPESGRDYAIVGRTDGTAFVDISDPYNPVYLGNLPKTEGSRSSIWRDMKVYRDHVYIVADAANEHGVQVFDLRALRDVRDPPVTFEETFVYDGIHSAHNIVINEQTGYAYAVGSSGGGETCGGGLHMITLEDPSRPAFAGCFADPTTGRRKTGYSHDAQCVRYHGPDAEHRGKEICLGSNETALSIADVSDKDNPVALSSTSYPNVAYTHQGWLSEDHRYFYQNDEGDEPQGLVAGTRTLVWDVTDLEDPILVNEYIAATTTTDHNLYVKGNLMYQSNYGSGLRVIDISNPEEPVEVGFFDTTPYGGGGSWSNYPYFESGVVVATSMGDGLFVLKPRRLPTLIP